MKKFKFLFILAIFSIFIIPSMSPKASSIDDIVGNLISGGLDSNNTFFSSYISPLMEDNVPTYACTDSGCVENVSLGDSKTILNTLLARGYNCIFDSNNSYISGPDLNGHSSLKGYCFLPSDFAYFNPSEPEFISSSMSGGSYIMKLNPVFKSGHNDYIYISYYYTYAYAGRRSMTISLKDYSLDSIDDPVDFKSFQLVSIAPNPNHYSLAENYYYSNFTLTNSNGDSLDLSLFDYHNSKTAVYDLDNFGDASITLNAGESALVYLEEGYSFGSLCNDVYYYTELVQYIDDNDYTSLMNDSNIPYNVDNYDDYEGTSIPDLFFAYAGDTYLDSSIIHSPEYVQYIYNRDSKPLTIKYFSFNGAVSIYKFTGASTSITITDRFGNTHTYKNLTNQLKTNATLNYGATNGNESSSNSPFSSLLDILSTIPDLIRTFGLVFSVIGSLFAIFFTTMPPFISAGLYAVFFLGLIILIIKALK